MRLFEPDRLEKLTSGVWDAKPGAALSGFVFDARKLRAGECFVALSGGTRDGHEFVEQAAAARAGAAIVERHCDVDLPQLIVRDSLKAMASVARWCRDQFTKPVVGVTGSSGKTSVKEMLRLLLGGDSVHATHENWNNLIGVPMTLFDLDDVMHEFAVVEAGINQPGEMRELGEMIYGGLTVLTNIGTAHLELLESQEGIAREKSDLARFAKKDTKIILPAQALKYEAFDSMASRCIALAVEGESVPVQLHALYRYRLKMASRTGRLDISVWRDGSTAVSHDFTVETMSRGIAENAALAFVASLELGLPAKLLPQRIAEWRPGKTRGKFGMIDGSFVYSDCYNANPNSMVDAIDAFARVAPLELSRLYVLGAMYELGSQAETFHSQAAEMMTLRPEDRAFFVGPENLVNAYFEGALSSGARPDQLKRVESAESIKSDIAGFRGALFLKGSRRIALETLIPDAAA